MNVVIRLKHILQQYGLDNYGITQRIAKDLGLHRHTIGKIYRNQIVNPSLDVLGKLCDWLSDHGVPREELPHTLLGAAPTGLWQAVAAPEHVRIYLGQRHELGRHATPILWISRRDSTVAGEVARLLSTPDATGGIGPTVAFEYVPFKASSSESEEDRKELKEDHKRARAMFRDMRSQEGHSSSSIIIGSMKVNFLVELMVAELFGTTAFKPPTGSPSVPFYLLYRRQTGRNVPSCFGGFKNPPGRRGPLKPGVYALQKDGGWDFCPWEAKVQDAGIVIVVHDPGLNRTDVAVFGFSGQGTEALGRKLVEDGDDFWPATAPVGGKQVGVFVCRFKLDRINSPETGEIVHARDCRIDPIDEGVLRRCLRKARPAKPSRKRR